MQDLLEICCGLDIHKKSIVACLCGALIFSVVKDQRCAFSEHPLKDVFHFRSKGIKITVIK